MKRTSEVPVNATITDRGYMRYRIHGGNTSVCTSLRCSHKLRRA